MQMWSGRASGRSNAADDLADLDLLADLNLDLRQVAVARRKSVAVVDLDHLAVAAAPAGGFHGAVGGGAHRVAGAAAEVETGVHRRPAEERIGPHAEAGRQVDLAEDRLSHRHSAE